MTSRVLDRPLNLAFVAQSASGKNRAVDAARELMPPEAIYLEKAGSARALIYTDESFEHRTVIVGERRELVIDEDNAILTHREPDIAARVLQHINIAANLANPDPDPAEVIFAHGIHLRGFERAIVSILSLARVFIPHRRHPAAQ